MLLTEVDAERENRSWEKRNASNDEEEEVEEIAFPSIHSVTRTHIHERREEMTDREKD